MNNIYAISLRKNTTVASDANTTSSRYPVVAYKAFRKFATRKQAREFKQNYSGNPVVIVNTNTQHVVR